MKKNKILIVDSNPSNLKVIRIIIESDNYELQTAINEQETLKKLKSFNPRLILIDITHPEMDGLKLIHQIRKNYNQNDLIILAITTYAMKSDEEKAMEAGCNGYLAKPIDIKILSDLIAKHLRMSNSQMLG